MDSSNAIEVAAKLLAGKGLRLETLTTLQSLWAGYGQICRVTAANTVDSLGTTTLNIHEAIPPTSTTYILKLIKPPSTKANDEGYTRKILSYQVEQYFYSHMTAKLPSNIAVAKCLASINEHHEDGTFTTAMILSDLSERYPVAGEKRSVLSSTQVNAAIDWLGGFHGFWWSRVKDMDRSSMVLPPLEEVRKDGQDAALKTIWLNGGYTYLATRRKEYADLVSDTDSEWNEALTRTVEGTSKSVAELVAMFLAPKADGSSPCKAYETLIHGDVKSENLFTNQRGDEVAFYDFQYTGLGLGVCDLAKLFTCSVPLSLLVTSENLPDRLTMQSGERKLLERYLNIIQSETGKDYDWNTFRLHWEIALVDWLRFQASWGLWGNTEWLEARVRSILADSMWIATLTRQLDQIDE